MSPDYIDVTQEAGADLFRRQIAGEIYMLNLLKFRDTADYSQNPELAQSEPISGAAAFQKYMDHTLPFLKVSGGNIFFLGKGARFLIGPKNERWDFVMLIRQNSLADFIAFSTNQAYLEGMGHRTAALSDSRLLPLESVTSALEILI